MKVAKFHQIMHTADDILNFEVPKSKLNEVCKGPHEIASTHTNGTVAIRLTPDGTDRVNIRRLKPA